MSAKSIVVEKPVRKKLLKLPVHVHKKIVKALTSIQENPLSGIKLHGELVQYYKYRVGDYRIVYQFNKKEKLVIVVKIEHRQGVYK